MKTIIYSILFFILFNILPAQNIQITQVNFNSSSNDFNSAITQNGRVIYFTSDRNDGEQKIFMVEKLNKGWFTTDELKGSINDGTQIGAVTLTSDGQFMIFAAYEHDVNGIGRTDLYSARKVNGKWKDVTNLGEDINSESWDSQPSISNDGNILFFSSDRPGGYGATDIYMSEKTEAGWSKPVNLGPTINTDSDEMTPVIAVDNKSFSFASNRYGGAGGFDIYISKLTGKLFSTSKNAGDPINSSSDEYFYYAMPNSDQAYFSSNRPGGVGELDIYKAIPNPYEPDKVFMLKGLVMDAVTKELLGADIIVTDLKTGQKVAELRSDDNTGEYNVILQPGRTYSITATKKDYLFYSDRYEVPVNEKGREETKDIYLSPISGGNTRLLIFFDFDKATLKDESKPELDRVVYFLKDNEDVKIMLEGHTDDVGTEEYNDQLSANRANAAMNYLTSAGISNSRIQTMGYGERKPLRDEKTEEARASNRRVEMKIVD